MNRILIALAFLAGACLAGGLALAQPPPPDAPDPRGIGAPVLIVQADGSTVAGQVALCWVPVPGGKGIAGPALAPAPLPTATATLPPPPGREATPTARGGPRRTPTPIIVQLTTTVIQARSPTPGGPWGP